MARRTFALLAFAALAAGGGVALAQGGSDPYELPEPKLRAGDVVGLAEAAGCDADGRVKIRFRRPPARSSASSPCRSTAARRPG